MLSSHGSPGPPLGSGSETMFDLRDENPFTLYSRAMHEYTLRLWTEYRKQAGERLQNTNTVGATSIGKEERRALPRSISTPVAASRSPERDSDVTESDSSGSNSGSE